MKIIQFLALALTITLGSAPVFADGSGGYKYHPRNPQFSPQVSDVLKSCSSTLADTNTQSGSYLQNRQTEIYEDFAVPMSLLQTWVGVAGGLYPNSAMLCDRQRALQLRNGAPPWRSAENAALDRKITVRNGGSQPIVGFYGAPSNKADWEDEMLGSDPILPGKTHILDVDNGSAECVYKLKLVKQNGQQLVHRNASVCGGGTWEITDTGEELKLASGTMRSGGSAAASPPERSASSSRPAAAPGEGNSAMFPIPRVTACADYTLLPEQGGYKYFQMRNKCNYGIQLYVKVQEDDRWTTYADLHGEIAPLATLKSQGVLKSSQMRTTLMAVCPSRKTVEARLQKKVTGVYTRNGTAWGCWGILENTGVGIAR